MIADLLRQIGPWAWVVLGLALIGAELLAPGAFMLWLGLAALLTGVIDGALGLSWQASLLVFAALSLAAVGLGRTLMRPREVRPAPSSLDHRGQALVGRIFTLDAPMRGGEGRVRVDDSSWRVQGPDAPEGASVRVVRVEGATLVVERA